MTKSKFDYFTYIHNIYSWKSLTKKNFLYPKSTIVTCLQIQRIEEQNDIFASEVWKFDFLKLSVNDSSAGESWSLLLELRNWHGVCFFIATIRGARVVCFTNHITSLISNYLFRYTLASEQIETSSFSQVSDQTNNRLVIDWNCFAIHLRTSVCILFTHICAHIYTTIWKFMMKRVTLHKTCILGLCETSSTVNVHDFSQDVQ